MKFLLSLLLTGCMCVHHANAQDTIAWTSSYKLKWQDFQGKVKLTAPYNAITSAGINYYFTLHKDKSLSFLVYNVFYKNKSWIAKPMDYLLAHEQGHFDIAEIFARTLRKNFSQYVLHVATIKADLEKIWDKMIDEKEAMNQLYDKETNYGEHSLNQQIWDKKIFNQLGALGKWAF